MEASGFALTTMSWIQWLSQTHFPCLESFFWTTTIGLAHGLFDGSMTPFAYITFSCAATSFQIPNGILLAACFQEAASPVWISISTKSVSLFCIWQTEGIMVLHQQFAQTVLLRSEVWYHHPSQAAADIIKSASQIHSTILHKRLLVICVWHSVRFPV